MGVHYDKTYSKQGNECLDHRAIFIVVDVVWRLQFTSAGQNCSGLWHDGPAEGKNILLVLGSSQLALASPVCKPVFQAAFQSSSGH